MHVKKKWRGRERAAERQPDVGVVDKSELAYKKPQKLISRI